MSASLFGTYQHKLFCEGRGRSYVLLVSVATPCAVLRQDEGRPSACHVDRSGRYPLDRALAGVGPIFVVLRS